MNLTNKNILVPAPNQPIHSTYNNSQRGGLLVLPVTLLLLYGALAAIEFPVLHFTGNKLIYPLDDTYIHLQLARNIYLHHTWGINAGSFASASSSLLYSVLLAFCFQLFGVHTLIPLIINCVAAGLLLAAAKKWLQQQGISPLAQLISLTAAILLTPLPVLVMSGMEHTLQCLFTFLFLFRFSGWLAQTHKEEKERLPWQLYAYGFLVTAIRYEGIFIIGLACLYLLFQRRLLQSIQLGLVSSLPILVFGIYSISKGSFFFPNSVLVKSDTIQLSVSGLTHLINNILVEKWTFARAGIAPLATQKLLLLLPLTYLLFYRQFPKSSPYPYLLSLLFFTTLLHLGFAATGWFYRYEAYLVFNSILLVSLIFLRFGKDWIAHHPPALRMCAFFLMAFLLFPVLLRSGTSFSKASRSAINIYEQQYQMAKFCGTFYNQKVIAANDIGAISFFTKDTILDLWGLANNEVARSRKKNYWTPDFLYYLTQKNRAGVAVIYDSWFSDSLRRRWSKVATWTIPQNVVCGDSTVSFYAVDTLNAPTLKAHLLQFAPSLPADISVHYY